MTGTTIALITGANKGIGLAAARRLAAVREVEARHGRLDVLVDNAGIGVRGPARWTTGPTPCARSSRPTSWGPCG